MPMYVGLMKWTEQGIKNVKGTVERSEEARKGVERMGGRIHQILWTQGQYDLVSIVEFQDEQAAAAYLLMTAGQGNLRTETMRAYTAEEMSRILEKMR